MRDEDDDWRDEREPEGEVNGTKLTIKFDGKFHFVDSIVGFKKSPTGSSLFQLLMHCDCCSGRTYWI